MNIFEQYGIKEVADCTLYAIELDKHDDEIYVPILYFDTLKVSSIEQNAEQTSARGGLGNPELIIWDYGKEISVSLEDALYNPASQSMMWGAKFGTKHSKIHGVWNPYIYPKDRYGKSIYLKKSVYKKKDSSSDKYYYMNADTMEVSDSIYKIESELLEGGYVKSICPCDGAEIMVKYFPNSGKYKYLKNSAYAPS